MIPTINTDCFFEGGGGGGGGRGEERGKTGNGY